MRVTRFNPLWVSDITKYIFRHVSGLCFANYVWCKWNEKRVIFWFSSHENNQHCIHQCRGENPLISFNLSITSFLDGRWFLMWDDVQYNTQFLWIAMTVTSNSAVSLSPRFLLFQANQANPCSEDYELFLSQVDYKRLSEDLSKIVNMKGKISLGSFVAPVKGVESIQHFWLVEAPQKNL